MMETLEIELSYIQHLIDDDVIKAVARCLNWDALHACASVFPIEIGHLNKPEDHLVQLIERKAGEYLCERRAEQLKAAWQQLDQKEQRLIALRIFEAA